ncbi:hypothetical protein CEE36_11330 [candidate division TA06 bacterium B3_TA06]|uniref:Uncharacterized protein n=1 Tax=candidate division TA06 bacterium B3_TA06 TaxID=2012487 RepID=A0A532UPL4_UNCT6|nr:MAG: hypothetical protein CEE36_11330 [candidate division TA06 bacterium B3_TA06]
MSVLDYIVGRMKRGVITFIGMVSLAHRDWPYHDHHSDTTTVVYQPYVVGENNIPGDGDQFKRFVAKSTLIFCTTNTRVIFNNSNNVFQTLLANTWYEFMTNIHQMFYRYSTEAGSILIYVEGVLPQEARRPE